MRIKPYSIKEKTEESYQEAERIFEKYAASLYHETVHESKLAKNQTIKNNNYWLKL